MTEIIGSIATTSQESGGSESSTSSTITIPLWHKLTLTTDEANALSGIGIGKLRELANTKDCPFILWNGTKYLFKRDELEKFLEESFSI